LQEAFCLAPLLPLREGVSTPAPEVSAGWEFELRVAEQPYYEESSASLRYAMIGSEHDLFGNRVAKFAELVEDGGSELAGLPIHESGHVLEQERSWP
jgi:hypothetical protein